MSLPAPYEPDAMELLISHFHQRPVTRDLRTMRLLDNVFRRRSNVSSAILEVVRRFPLELEQRSSSSLLLPYSFPVMALPIPCYAPAISLLNFPPHL